MSSSACASCQCRSTAWWAREKLDGPSSLARAARHCRTTVHTSLHLHRSRVHWHHRHCPSGHRSLGPSVSILCLLNPSLSYGPSPPDETASTTTAANAHAGIVHAATMALRTHASAPMHACITCTASLPPSGACALGLGPAGTPQQQGPLHHSRKPGGSGGRPPGDSRPHSAWWWWGCAERGDAAVQPLSRWHVGAGSSWGRPGTAMGDSRPAA